MLAYDSTNLNSFNNMKAWLGQIETHANADVHKILVATKMDDEEHRQVTEEQGEAFAREHDLPIHFTSAHTGDHVHEPFEAAAKLAVARQAESMH